MRSLWEYARLSFLQQFSYRTANLAGLTTNLFFGLLRIAMLSALYGARHEVAGVPLTAAITYTGLTQALLTFLNPLGWTQVARSIYLGDISTDLLRPVQYFNSWLARDLGRSIARLVLRGIPIMLLYTLVFSASIPHDLLHWLCLLLALLLGWLVNFSWRFLTNLSAFWTHDAQGIIRFTTGIAVLLSGFFLPLRLFPAWFIDVCNLTPFPSMVNTPAEVYLGLLDGPDLLRAMSMQLLWFLLLLALVQVVLHAGLRKLSIAGG